jgi:hypothetical protein
MEFVCGLSIVHVEVICVIEESASKMVTAGPVVACCLYLILLRKLAEDF